MFRSQAQDTPALDSIAAPTLSRKQKVYRTHRIPHAQAKPLPAARVAGNHCTHCALLCWSPGPRLRRAPFVRVARPTSRIADGGVLNRSDQRSINSSPTFEPAAVAEPRALPDLPRLPGSHAVGNPPFADAPPFQRSFGRLRRRRRRQQRNIERPEELHSLDHASGNEGWKRRSLRLDIQQGRGGLSIVN